MHVLSIHIRIVGAIFLLLGIAHFFFSKEFGWKDDLAKLSLLNRQLFQVHTFFIVLVLFLFGILSLFFSHALLDRSPLSQVVLAGLVIFWAARLFVQLFVFDSRLWRGNRRNTIVHVLFTLIWSYAVMVYSHALWYALD